MSSPFSESTSRTSGCGDFEILLKELLDLIDILLALVCLDDNIKDDRTEEDMYDFKTYTCASLIFTRIHARFRWPPLPRSSNTCTYFV